MGYKKDKQKFFGSFNENLFYKFKNKAKNDGWYLSAKINDLLSEYIKKDKIIRLEYGRSRKTLKKVNKTVYLEKSIDDKLNKFKKKYGLNKIDILELVMKEYVNNTNDNIIKEHKGHQNEKIQSSYKLDYDIYMAFSEKSKKAGRAVVDQFSIVIKNYISEFNIKDFKKVLCNPNIYFDKIRYNVLIEPSLKSKLKKISQKYQLEMSDIINVALFKYINKNR